MRRLYTRGWHFVKHPLGHEGLRVRRSGLLTGRLGSRRLRGSETPLKTLIPQGSTKWQPLRINLGDKDRNTTHHGGWDDIKTFLTNKALESRI